MTTSLRLGRTASSEAMFSAFGYDGEPLAVSERPRHLDRGCPPVSPTAIPSDDARCRLPSDPALLFSVTDPFVAQGELVGDCVSDRPAMGTRQEALLFQHGRGRAGLSPA